MRFYGIRSGRNNIPKLIIRSYKYYERQQKNNTNRNRTNTYKNSTNDINRNNKCLMEQEVVSKNLNLNEKYNLYDELIEWEIKQSKQFSFNKLMKNYVPKSFEYKLPYPVKQEPELLQVPKESWLEKIFTSRKQHRLDIIEKNTAILEKMDDQYKYALEEYKKNKEIAYLEWQKQELDKKRNIDEHNQEIEEWKWKYSFAYSEAINLWIEHIKKSIKPIGDVKFTVETKFNESNRYLYVKIKINSMKEVFAFSEYKYLPRKKEIRAVDMKVRERTEHSRKLIENILYSMLYKFYYNDIGDVIKILVVDLVSDELMLGSCWCSQKDAKCAKNRERIFIDSSQIRICKNIQKEVQSFMYNPEFMNSI